MRMKSNISVYGYLKKKHLFNVDAFVPNAILRRSVYILVKNNNFFRNIAMLESVNSPSNGDGTIH